MALEARGPSQRCAHLVDIRERLEPLVAPAQRRRLRRKDAPHRRGHGPLVAYPAAVARAFVGDKHHSVARRAAATQARERHAVKTCCKAWCGAATLIRHRPLARTKRAAHAEKARCEWRRQHLETPRLAQAAWRITA
eukprot:472615-Prymnesium_polylepis.1